MNNRKFRNWLKRREPNFEKGDSESCQKSLNGDAKHGSALCWFSSPQGADFWYAFGDKARYSKRTRRFLAKLRDEARRRGC